eukprot:2828625-Prorocentrum_lima.AAC.1
MFLWRSPPRRTSARRSIALRSRMPRWTGGFTRRSSATRLAVTPPSSTLLQWMKGAICQAGQDSFCADMHGATQREAR